MHRRVNWILSTLLFVSTFVGCSIGNRLPNDFSQKHCPAFPQAEDNLFGYPQQYIKFSYKQKSTEREAIRKHLKQETLKHLLGQIFAASTAVKEIVSISAIKSEAGESENISLQSSVITGIESKHISVRYFECDRSSSNEYWVIAYTSRSELLAYYRSLLSTSEQLVSECRQKPDFSGYDMCRDRLSELQSILEGLKVPETLYRIDENTGLHEIAGNSRESQSLQEQLDITRNETDEVLRHVLAILAKSAASCNNAYQFAKTHYLTKAKRFIDEALPGAPECRPATQMLQSELEAFEIVRLKATTALDEGKPYQAFMAFQEGEALCLDCNSLLPVKERIQAVSQKFSKDLIRLIKKQKYRINRLRKKDIESSYAFVLESYLEVADFSNGLGSLISDRAKAEVSKFDEFISTWISTKLTSKLKTGDRYLARTRPEIYKAVYQYRMAIVYLNRAKDDFKTAFGSVPYSKLNAEANSHLAQLATDISIVSTKNIDPVSMSFSVQVVLAPKGKAIQGIPIVCELENNNDYYGSTTSSYACSGIADRNGKVDCQIGDVCLPKDTRLQCRIDYKPFESKLAGAGCDGACFKYTSTSSSTPATENPYADPPKSEGDGAGNTDVFSQYFGRTWMLELGFEKFIEQLSDDEHKLVLALNSGRLATAISHYVQIHSRISDYETRFSRCQWYSEVIGTWQNAFESKNSLPIYLSELLLEPRPESCDSCGMCKASVIVRRNQTPISGYPVYFSFSDGQTMSISSNSEGRSTCSNKSKAGSEIKVIGDIYRLFERLDRKTQKLLSDHPEIKEKLLSLYSDPEKIFRFHDHPQKIDVSFSRDQTHFYISLIYDPSYSGPVEVTEVTFQATGSSYKLLSSADIKQTPSATLVKIPISQNLSFQIANSGNYQLVIIGKERCGAFSFTLRE